MGVGFKNTPFLTFSTEDRGVLASSVSVLKVTTQGLITSKITRLLSLAPRASLRGLSARSRCLGTL
eukprot:CAMPEP_0184314042 /NCGR_PEP_ID=MMETSP1049-20130417/70576_1 /TAXON_ID=77928 /ORGANISM="Proteomonas sulcata, Strain CCMP704" /LENGTH=65 /DNA_ID=CAMNT_0026631749 /DNA_START=412 /DNA_END=606 /DNA_ORIENTATION=+